MTNPFPAPNINPQVRQQPGTGDVFLQMLLKGGEFAQQAQQIELQKQALKVRQQELKLAEQEHQARMAEAARKMQEQQLRGQADTIASRHFRDFVVGQGTTEDLPTVLRMAQMDPEANGNPYIAESFAAQAEQYFKPQEAGQKVEETGQRIAAGNLELRQRRDEEARRQQIKPYVDRLLANPDAKLPTNPSIGQAVAMEQLRILGLVTQLMDQEARQAGENAQSDMLVRQSVVAAYAAAAKARNDALAVADPGDAVPSVRELVPGFLPAGISPEEAETIYQESVRNFLRRRGATGDGETRNLALPPAMDRLLQHPTYLKQDRAMQRNMVDAAYAVARGGSLAEGLDPSTRAWVRAAAKILSQK